MCWFAGAKKGARYFVHPLRFFINIYWLSDGDNALRKGKLIVLGQIQGIYNRLKSRHCICKA